MAEDFLKLLTFEMKRSGITGSMSPQAMLFCNLWTRWEAHNAQSMKDAQDTANKAFRLSIKMVAVAIAAHEQSQALESRIEALESRLA